MPWVARLLLLAAVAAGLAAGLLASGSAETAQATAEAGADLTRLLRAMAALKAVVAAGLTASMVWRLGLPVGAGRFSLYALAGVAMAAGVGLIWDIAHVAAGALLLHGGLLAVLLLLWRDPAVGERLGAIVAARRAALRTR
jgi:hypothetical protein